MDKQSGLNQDIAPPTSQQIAHEMSSLLSDFLENDLQIYENEAYKKAVTKLMKDLDKAKFEMEEEKKKIVIRNEELRQSIATKKKLNDDLLSILPVLIDSQPHLKEKLKMMKEQNEKLQQEFDADIKSIEKNLLDDISRMQAIDPGFKAYMDLVDTRKRMELEEKMLKHEIGEIRAQDKLRLELNRQYRNATVVDFVKRIQAHREIEYLDGEIQKLNEEYKVLWKKCNSEEINKPKTETFTSNTHQELMNLMKIGNKLDTRVPQAAKSIGNTKPCSPALSTSSTSINRFKAHLSDEDLKKIERRKQKREAFMKQYLNKAKPKPNGLIEPKPKVQIQENIILKRKLEEVNKQSIFNEKQLSQEVTPVKRCSQEKKRAVADSEYSPFFSTSQKTENKLEKTVTFNKTDDEIFKVPESVHMNITSNIQDPDMLPDETIPMFEETNFLGDETKAEDDDNMFQFGNSSFPASKSRNLFLF